ncbi:DNA primase [Micromonospora sp. DT81.3]|uniref:DNA primase n=1 Tax=Micromonospora sp. DT81.3 TaxID=3416523 RepID=UPI003CFB3BDF
MAGRIRQADVEEVKARTNIADIVEERVALKSAGVGSLKGLCPFHDERSPSFHVRPGVGFYHCFGCGESGDVYSFLRAMDHVSFTEAVERLAGRIGYSLHYEDGGATPETSGRTRLFAANTAAAEFFRAQLATPEAETGRRFLGERGFDAGAASHFGVGYAPKGWESMTNALTAQGFSREELIAAGLVSQGQRGVYDRFRGRLVWPIRDVTGQIVGFGARKLYDDDQGPKYLNTPETQIYKKAQVLYGLDLAKRDITRGDPRRVVVVEGYTDVMACHLAGVTTAIATCGTAFGTDHITVLRRVMGDDSGSGEVVFTFDPDAAGQKAALRAFAEEKRFNAQTYVAVAPDGLDPCDLRLQKGDVAVRSLMERKVPMFEFVIDQRLKGYDLSSVEGRVGGLRSAAPILAEIRDALLRPGYERVLARRLGMDPTEVHVEVERAARRSTPRDDAPATEPAELGSPLERVTLAGLPRHHDVALERDALMAFLQYGHRIDPELFARAIAIPFRHPALDAVRSAVAAAPDPARPGWAMDTIQSVREPYRTLAGELLARPLPATDEAGAVAVTGELARNLIVRSLDGEKNELLGAVQRVPADSEEGRRVRVRLRDLDAERQRLLNEQ